MLGLRLACALGVATLAAAQDEKAPERADEPFRIFVSVLAEGEDEALEEARAELVERLLDNDAWFLAVPTAGLAEIVVDLDAYWTRSERRYMSTWGVVPPTEGGQPDKTQTFEIVTYHSLRGRVEFFGTQRSVEASTKTSEGGRPKDAAGSFASELERTVKDEYWELMARREAAKGSP